MQIVDYRIARSVCAFVWLPAIFYALALLPVMFYGRYEILEPGIAATLRSRRAAPGTS